jgi:hypothetical protein
MNDRMPWDITAAGADGEKTAPAARPRPGQQLIAVMLLTAAALDLTRCGLVLAAARHPVPTAGLAAAGLAAAVLTARTARGCQASQPWARWTALLIGAASAPQAAISGFHNPYTIPDTATAALGILLAVVVLATAGAAGQPGRYTENPCTIDREPPGDPPRTPPAAARRAQAATAHGREAAAGQGDDVGHSGHCQSRLREERQGAAGRPLTKMPAPGPGPAGPCCHCGGTESISARPEPAGRQEP